MEEWSDIRRFPNHQVSTYVQIRNKKTGYILKPYPDKYGYLRLSIGSVDNVQVHRVVCETFYGPSPKGKPQVNHIDCDRQNNHVDNLEWCSPRENVMHAYLHGRLDPNVGLKKAVQVNKKPVRIVETGQEFETVKSCAEFLDVPPTHLSRCLVGYRKGQRIHGYHVEFV